MRYLGALLLAVFVVIGCGSKDDGEIPDIKKAAQNPETNTFEAGSANSGQPVAGAGTQRTFGKR